MKEDQTPLLHPVEIVSIRPTQMTVGQREVEAKRAAWRKQAERNGPDFLGRHMIPVIMGPRRVPYCIDHHHLLRALHDEGVTHVLISVVADLGDLRKPDFWTFMENRNWLHPYDAEGHRQPHDRLPRTVAAMKDDPYRSLAGELRRAGGYAKDATPYSEFLWADFLRRRVRRKLVDQDYQRAVAKALKAAADRSASYLPGWCGVSDEKPL